MRNHLLASEGYCVVSIDSRGSHNRGTAFEAHLRHRMGQVSSSKQKKVKRKGKPFMLLFDDRRALIEPFSDELHI